MVRKMNYFFAPIDGIPETLPFKRVGIVPFFVENEIPNFFLMLDSKFKELTDCGGLPKDNEAWLETAIRETEEESRGIFIFDKNYISKSGLVFWREDFRIAIIFVDITCRIKNSTRAGALCHRYRIDYLRGIERKDRRDRLENSDMHFYKENEIKDVCRNNGKIYIPVKMLFLKFFRHNLQHKLISIATETASLSLSPCLSV